MEINNHVPGNTVTIAKFQWRVPGERLYQRLRPWMNPEVRTFNFFLICCSYVSVLSHFVFVRSTVCNNKLNRRLSRYSLHLKRGMAFWSLGKMYILKTTCLQTKPSFPKHVFLSAGYVMWMCTTLVSNTTLLENICGTVMYNLREKYTAVFSNAGF